jgi:tight adherence protein C
LIAMLWGVGFGLGLTALWYGLRPPAVGLAEAERILNDHAPNRSAAQPIPADLEHRLTAPAVRALSALGLPSARTRADLARIGQDPETFLAKKTTAGIAGLLLPSGLQAALAAGGVAFPAAVVFGMGLVMGLVLFLFPDADVHRAAEAARTESRAALGALLSFAATGLQAGDGIEEALTSASAVGDGPSFVRFRAASAKSRLSRRSIWDCYAELGAELHLPELSELGASIQLAGSEGARIADSLTAKATALRGRLQADGEAHAASATERMHVPIGLMLMAFLLILGFPAVYTITTGL